jgi:hypothetical protein
MLLERARRFAQLFGSLPNSTVKIH